MIFLFIFLVRSRVILEKEHYVDRDGNASLHCQVEGSPLPTISWIPCNPQENVCNRGLLNISRVQSERSNYTCTANNSLGEDSASTSLSKLTLVLCTIQASFTKFSSDLEGDERCVSSEIIMLEDDGSSSNNNFSCYLPL